MDVSVFCKFAWQISREIMAASPNFSCSTHKWFSGVILFNFWSLDNMLY